MDKQREIEPNKGGKRKRKFYFQLLTFNFRLLPALLTLLTTPITAQVVLRNSGEMYVGGESGATGLYIRQDFSARGASVIAHPGKTVLIGNFFNHVTGTSTVFKADNRSGIFSFQGITKPQTVSSTVSKATNYITFPNTVVINNEKDSVIFDATVAANMKGLNFIKGRLILDSKTTGTSGDSILVAHLWLEDGATTIANTATVAKIQVNLNLGTPAGRLTGFASPFETLYADYFFFNFLSVPSETELFKGNSNELWNTNPKRTLKAGEGYILGKELVPYTTAATGYYVKNRAPEWSTANVAQMIRQKFTFNRHVAPSTFKTFVNNDATITDKFTGEKLVNADVARTLINGYNYLGNPFMVPLDLSDLVTANRTAWGITGTNVEQKYYVLSKGKGQSTNGTTFTFTSSYLVGQAVGNTADKNHLLAPMQLFIVKNNGVPITGFKIPRAKRKHGVAYFLRSMEEDSRDELLVEVRDTKTGGFDRLSVVFRPGASLAATDLYDAEKLFNRSGGVSQIYTRSMDNKELSINTVPPSTQSLTLYLEPSLEAQEVELETSRLESLVSVTDVILEDTKTKEKVNIGFHPLYRFTSLPSDPPGRFVLHFSQNPTSKEIENQLILTASYRSGTTFVYGLAEEEKGENLFLYNTNGELLYREKVTETSPHKIVKPLQKGIYIIRTETGKTTKLMVND